MAEVTAVIGLLAMFILIGFSVSEDNADRDRCKSLGMVVVHYDHKSYCANIGDLK